MPEFSTEEAKVLNLIQREFPMTERPFDALGAMVGISGADVLGILGSLKERSIVRTISGIFSGGMLGLFLLSYFTRRTGNVSAALGTLTGLLFITWMTFSPRLSVLPPSLRSHFHSFMIPVIGTLVIFLVGLSLGSLQKKG